MLAAPSRDWNVFKQIFAEHWDGFTHAHPRYQTSYYDGLVAKMLGCGNPEKMGSIEYRCLHCGQGKHLVAMSCKSSLCLRCAKVYVDNWVSQVSQVLHEGVIYRHIILPMSKPVLTVLAVFTIVGVWNDFTGPLIYLNNSDQFTLAIALDYFRRSAFSTMSVNTTNLVMAASLLSVVPILILYFFLQEYLIGGIASVGLKG